MDLGLDGARALVGGASAGLGAAVAEELVREGVKVALAARSAGRLDDAAERLGGVAVRVDLSTAQGPREAVDQAVRALGGLDLLVVNTGGPPPGKFDELDEAAWQRAIDGTLWSSVRLIRAALGHLRSSDRGAIVVVLSSSSREPIPGLTTSNLLRPGLAGLVKSLAAEIAPIRINAIAPGRIATNRIEELDAARAAASGRAIDDVRGESLGTIPLGRYGDASDVGRAAAFLLSPAAGYITGVNLAVDGGMVRALP
jgi:3-oxoacyl-[acyl-carrier protein] reductase